MYEINTPAVYAHETVMSNPMYRGRVERVVAALKQPRPIVTYNDDQIPDLIQKEGLLKRCVVMGTLSEVQDPVLLFNTFRFDSKEDEKGRAKSLEDRGVKLGGHRDSLLGAGAFHWANYNLDCDPAQHDKVCRPCWRIHLEKGCLHQCKYCSLGGLLVSMVNIEDYCRHLGEIIQRHPWQKTYLLDDDADPPGLEPEMGTLGYLIEFFGTLKDRYLIIHTKTWNTEWMRGLKHNDNTIIVWSVSGPTQSRLIEPNTGTTDQRIEAARIAQEAGYQIRYKFKPIIPVANWRQEATDMLEKLFAAVQPDNLSMEMLFWYGDTVAQVKEMFDMSLFDPELIKLMEKREAEGQVTDQMHPFPDEFRAEVYGHYMDEIRRISPDCRVSLCAETKTMWELLGPKLRMTGTSFVCNCGPICVPYMEARQVGAAPDGKALVV